MKSDRGRLKKLYILLIAFSQLVFGRESEKSYLPLFGHNLTPTSYTLADKQLTLGTYVVGYGLSENVTIGTCPWLVLAYNMPMIEMKVAFHPDIFFERISIDANYFKTFPYARNLYEQESTFLRVTGTHKFTEIYSLHVSVGHQYFFNDNRPFSLRLIPGNGSRTNLSLSTLNEINLIGNLGMFVELGLIGLNYSVPWLHTGLSGFYWWGWGLIQFGYSRTVSLGGVRYYVGGDNATVVYWHPEIQFQVFF